MNKTVLALSVLCVALAALDVKLLTDWRARRAAGTASALQLGAEPAAAGGSSGANGSAPDSGTRPRPARKKPSPQEAQRAADADFLRMYADPRTRQQLVDEYALNQRETLNGVDRALDIDYDRWTMLSRRLAELEIEAQKRRMGCAQDPDCLRTGMIDSFAQRNQVIDEVLGAVKAAELKTYNESLQERRAVEGLQSRLGESRLSRERSDELIRALHEEGMRVFNQWGMNASNPTLTTRGFAYGDLGRIFYPSTATTFEQRVASATQYSRHLRERAAPLLSSEQRAAFDVMQDELLKRFERQLRRESQGS